MTTISQAVYDVVSMSPFIEEGLSKGIINYAYLADMIKPEVERIARKQTNRYAIVMALRRMTIVLEGGFVATASKMMENASINLTSNMCCITIKRSQSAIKSASMLYNAINFENKDFLTITFGTYEINIIANMKDADKIISMFHKEDIAKKSSNLSSLAIRITKNAAESVGLLYSITKALSWEGINIIEVVSTYTEEIFIVSDIDAARAFDAIRRISIPIKR